MESPEKDTRAKVNGKASLARRIVGTLFIGFYYFFYLLMILWAAGALYFNTGVIPVWSTVIVFLWFGAVIAATVFSRPHWRGLVAVLIAVGAIMIWHASIRPRQDSEWQEVHSRTPYADIDGDLVTVHDIRDFIFRSPTDFTSSYVTRTFDLGKLEGVDLILNYWGSRNMSHPIMSFDFGGGDHLSFSIETRREKSEGFSALGGLYKMFELIYVACTERDCILLRAVSPGEESFLYRCKFGKEEARILFLQYVSRINELHSRPEFYNALTANCTTSIRRQNSPERRRPWDWRLLINGDLDRLLHEHGIIESSMPFDELKKSSSVTAKALEARDAPDFSDRIRGGNPAPGD